MNMKHVRFLFFLPLLLLCWTSGTRAQQQATAYQNENMTPETFSEVLKTEWFFLRDELDKQNQNIGKRGEFETTAEFHDRIATLRKNFLSDLPRHTKTYGVWLKATLVSYDADAQEYSVTCPVTIEAPYNIPTVACVVPGNKYVELIDSTLNGYRTSKLHLKFDPDFKWKVERDQARKAKGEEANVYFKVHFMVELTQESFDKEASIHIIPKDILLADQVRKTAFWKEEIR
jgi:hypothetical protein